MYRYLLKYLVAFFLFSFQFPSFGQANRLDSLFLELKTAKDSNRVNVLNLLAKEYQDSDVDIAFKYCHEALALAEKINFKTGISKSANILGVIYELQQIPKSALEYFLYSLRIQKELKNDLGIGKAYINVAIAYAEQGKLDSSRLFMLDARKLYEKINEKKELANLLINIGGTYDLEQNWSKALEYYNQSLAISIESDNKKGISKCLNNIGYVYFKKHDFLSAKKYLLQSNEMADKIHDRRVSLENYEILANIYMSEKQFEKAYGCRVIYGNIKDSLLNEKNVKQFHEFEKKYEAGKKQKQIEILNKEKETQELLTLAENKRKNGIIVFIATVLFLIVIFFVLLFSRFRITQKQKLIIEEKQKEILDSINYAKRIQNSLLPKEKYIDKTIDRLKGR